MQHAKEIEPGTSVNGQPVEHDAANSPSRPDPPDAMRPGLIPSGDFAEQTLGVLAYER